MQSVFEIFQNLKKEPLNESDGFNVAPLPLQTNHKIGMSSQRQPMFFIECDESSSSKPLNTNLEFIAVQFNCKCQLLSENRELVEGIYTIISLKIDSADIQEYFIDVVYLLIQKLARKPKFQELRVEVEKLINLFSKFSKPPTKTIQGLWAELLVIEQSKNVEYLIRAWHNSTTDKFDFNDGIDKIEVKSTARNKRVHSFSIEQLNPNINSKLLVASVFVVETGMGKNIFDLADNIQKVLKDKNVFFRVNEILAQTLGKDFEKAFDIYFDYQLAMDSLQYYEGATIPTIDVNNISQSISNVRFESDLTGVPTVDTNQTASVLHKALF
jgi:hypothetical protein